MARTKTPARTAPGFAAELRRIARSPWHALRLPFLLVYVIGLASEVGAFWRLDASTTTLLAAGFTAFGLLGTICFGLVRALPPDADAQARAGLAAGRGCVRAAVLALAALLVVHGWSEGWPGMRLLGSFRVTDLLVRALFVALGVATASAGLLGIWRIDDMLTERRTPGA